MHTCVGRLFLLICFAVNEELMFVKYIYVAILLGRQKQTFIML